MFAATIIKEVENSLDTVIDAHVVPVDSAYPTSGTRFIRLCGDSESVSLQEGTLRLMIDLSVTVSVRVGKYPQRKGMVPYFEIITLAESVFVHLLTDQTILSTLIAAFPPPISLTDRFTCDRIDLTPTKVGPEFYSSTTNADRDYVGLKIVQRIQSPIITVPLDCFSVPESIENTLFWAN